MSERHRIWLGFPSPLAHRRVVFPRTRSLIAGIAALVWAFAQTWRALRHGPARS